MSFRPLSMASKGVLVPYVPPHSVLWKEKGEALKPRILVKKVFEEEKDKMIRIENIDISVKLENGEKNED